MLGIYLVLSASRAYVLAMRTFLVSAIVLWSLPAMAATCPYVASNGDRATFVSDGENTVTITTQTGDVSCTWGVNGDTGSPDIECADGSKGDYFFAPAKRNGNGQDLLIYEDHVWYRECP